MYPWQKVTLTFLCWRLIGLFEQFEVDLVAPANRSRGFFLYFRSLCHFDRRVKQRVRLQRLHLYKQQG